MANCSDGPLKVLCKEVLGLAIQDGVHCSLQEENERTAGDGEEEDGGEDEDEGGEGEYCVIFLGWSCLRH